MDYPRLISNVLAVELASVFGLPDGEASLISEEGARRLVPVLDAITGEIIIPMLFAALDQREQIRLTEAKLRLSLGDRERLYRLIIDVAMARVWQTASGDTTGQAAYLAHLAARSTAGDGDSFLAWRGIDGAIWRQRIRTHLQPAERPFAVLGLLTSHYLHTHVFSITGYLIARQVADALIEHEAGRARLPVDVLAAELMNRAKLPLLGIDSLFTIASAWSENAGPSLPIFATSEAAATGPCAGWQFFQTADRRLSDERSQSERPADQAYAKRIEASLRDQEQAVARHLSAFLPGQTASSIRFAGFDVATWTALVQEPAGCGPSQHVAIADAVPGRESVAAKPSDQACEAVLRHARILADNRQHAALCTQIERMFPKDARDLLLANLAKGRQSVAERSAITISLALLPNGTP